MKHSTVYKLFIITIFLTSILFIILGILFLLAYLVSIPMYTDYIGCYNIKYNSVLYFSSSVWFLITAIALIKKIYIKIFLILMNITIFVLIAFETILNILRDRNFLSELVIIYFCIFIIIIILSLSKSTRYYNKKYNRPLHYKSITSIFALFLLTFSFGYISIFIKNKIEFYSVHSIYDAAAIGNIKFIENLRLDNNFYNINKKNREGFTPLHIAVIYDKEDVIKYLIKIGANVNVQDNEGVSPLHIATYCGNLKNTQLLINAGANVNIFSKEYGTPLSMALWNIREYCFQGPLFDTIELLLKNKANVHSQREAPLFGAITTHKGFLIIKLLIDNNANINAQNYSGDTPLHVAVQGLDIETIDYLLNVGAIPNIRNHKGETPLGIINKMIKTKTNYWGSNLYDESINRLHKIINIFAKYIQ